MADAQVDVLGLGELPLVAGLYGEIFTPARDADSLKRHFIGRYNELVLIASQDDRPVGFYLGYEADPRAHFGWLLGVLPDARRQGVASQLLDAAEEWARNHQYETLRCEVHSHARAMQHMAIAREYDITGLRWDPDVGTNVVIFEKPL